MWKSEVKCSSFSDLWLVPQAEKYAAQVWCGWWWSHFGDEDDESDAVSMISCGVLKEPDVFEAVVMDLGCIQILSNQMMAIVASGEESKRFKTHGCSTWGRHSQLSSAYQTSFHGTWYLPSEQADASGKEAYQEMVLTLRLWWLFNFPEVESRVVLTHDCREGLWISKSHICLQCCYL